MTRDMHLFACLEDAWIIFELFACPINALNGDFCAFFPPGMWDWIIWVFRCLLRSLMLVSAPLEAHYLYLAFIANLFVPRTGKKKTFFFRRKKLAAKDGKWVHTFITFMIPMHIWKVFDEWYVNILNITIFAGWWRLVAARNEDSECIADVADEATFALMIFWFYWVWLGHAGVLPKHQQSNPRTLTHWTHILSFGPKKMVRGQWQTRYRYSTGKILDMSPNLIMYVCHFLCVTMRDAIQDASVMTHDGMYCLQVKTTCNSSK